jgi:hypothetical protein
MAAVEGLFRNSAFICLLSPQSQGLRIALAHIWWGVIRSLAISQVKSSLMLAGNSLTRQETQVCADYGISFVLFH